MPRNTAFGTEERLAWLRLIRSEHVGPISFYQLLARFGSAAAALEALPDLACRGGRDRAPHIPTRAAVERELAKIESFGGEIICRDEPAYPLPLAAIEDSPPVLILRGRRELLSRDMIGIVGARNASANGRRFAHTLAAELGQAGLVVVSGLARGIDASAHDGALATGTVAVMAGGVDVVYPEENRALYERIVAEGLAVSEMPPATIPQARHFPRRNRIISGLSRGVVVIEAAERSGSLITARLALEQGREVFAVPGSPLDPRCRGTNGLIRQGAVLTESAADVLGALGNIKIGVSRVPPPAAQTSSEKLMESDSSEARRLVLESLGPHPVPVDEIVRQCHVSPAMASMILLELELAGRLERHSGQRVSLLS
ncbi:MAG TPA: DNA-processing protein DprA [Alphaproteobacteria bacterium]|nr:DNA-processing protein DprA [Alphaproteobacteria bacterium]